jgi:nitronate monooxygenase
MEWKTRVTELLGCQYPILQGAIAGLGNWKFAAAVAGAGAHGTITGAVSRTPKRLREDIRRCQEATAGAPGTFGVNLSIGLCPQIEEMLEVCLDEHVPVETSVYKPDALAPRIKEAGAKWIHKAARVKDALHAEEFGPDAIIMVGLEGAGIKSPEQLPTMTTTIWGARQMKAPLIAAGGIGDAHGFLAALAMGAEGIMMGTAFLATREFPMKDTAKEEIIQLSPADPELRQRVMVPVQFRMTDASNAEPSTPEPGRMVSFTVGVLDRVPTVKELIDGIIRGAEEILESWQFLRTR